MEWGQRICISDKFLGDSGDHNLENNSTKYLSYPLPHTNIIKVGSIVLGEKGHLSINPWKGRSHCWAGKFRKGLKNLWETKNQNSNPFCIEDESYQNHSDDLGQFK